MVSTKSGLQDIINTKDSEDDGDKNVTGRICKVTAFVYIVFIIIASLDWASKLNNWIIFFAGCVGGFFTGIILWGIGEIVRLLHELLQKANK